MLITFCACSENGNCSDFKEGDFIVPSDSETNIPYQIIRKKDSQIEIVSDPEFSGTSYINIEWINDCSYISKYDTSKMELTEFQKYINDNGGIVTEIIGFDGKCALLKSTLTVDGIADVIESKLCPK